MAILLLCFLLTRSFCAEVDVHEKDFIADSFRELSNDVLHIHGTAMDLDFLLNGDGERLKSDIKDKIKEFGDAVKEFKRGFLGRSILMDVSISQIRIEMLDFFLVLKQLMSELNLIFKESVLFLNKDVKLTVKNLFKSFDKYFEREEKVDPLMKEELLRLRWVSKICNLSYTCPNMWTYKTKPVKTCYNLTKEVLSWNDAKSNCAFKNSHLAQIKSSKEQKSLVELLDETWHDTGMDTYWIGLFSKRTVWKWAGVGSFGKDKVVDDFFVWANANAMDFAHDQIGCVSVSKRDGWKWRVDNCDQEHHYICEVDVK